MPQSYEDLKHLVEVLAILAGGIAFAYWYFKGILHPGMKIKLNASKSISASEQQFIDVSLGLENPGKASLAFRVIEIRLRKINTDDLEIIGDSKRITPRRVSFDGEILDWSNKSGDPINLAPRDSIQIGHAFNNINPDVSYLVEVMIITSRPKKLSSLITDTMQWYASRAVSPNQENEKSVKDRDILQLEI